MMLENILEGLLHSGCVMSANDGELYVAYGEFFWNKTPTKNAVSFYFPDFFLKNETPFCTFSKVLKMKREVLKEVLDNWAGSLNVSFHWNTPNKEEYQENFKELKEEYIDLGILKKGVPYTVAKAASSLQKEQLVRSLQSMLYTDQSNRSYLYGFWDNEAGVLGMTPELLFTNEASGKNINTVACAGTCSFEESAESLLKNPKDREEHQLVVDGIYQALSLFGKVELKPLQVLELPQLKHLFTPILLKPDKEASFLDLVKALHPTPALGTFPKKRGERWLESLGKKVTRERFGAPVGYLSENQKDFSCYVGIRNVQWNKKEAFIGVGGGVVTDSLLETEWKEILLKLSAIKKMLALETVN